MRMEHIHVPTFTVSERSSMEWCVPLPFPLTRFVVASTSSINTGRPISDNFQPATNGPETTYLFVSVCSRLMCSDSSPALYLAWSTILLRLKLRGPDHPPRCLERSSATKNATKIQRNVHGHYSSKATTSPTAGVGNYSSGVNSVSQNSWWHCLRPDMEKIAWSSNTVFSARLHDPIQPTFKG